MAKDPPAAAAAPLPSARYTPWPTLGPTNWTPFAVVNDTQTRVGGLVTGAPPARDQGRKGGE